MSIESILIVLWYSAKPYLGLMTLLMFILLGSYLMKLKKPSFNNKKRLIASCLVGILVGLLAPAITLSKLAYVTTYTDWAALISSLSSLPPSSLTSSSFISSTMPAMSGVILQLPPSLMLAVGAR